MIYALPNLRLFRPKSIAWQLLSNVAFNRSPTNGVITTSEIPGDAWSVRLEYGVNYHADRLKQTALFNRIRGPANIFRCFNVAQPEPRGTLRGTPTIYTSVAFGSNTIQIATLPGATLLAGDRVGVTGPNGYPLMIEAAEDATANSIGTLLLPMTMPLRYTIAGGTQVVWQRPYADFIILQPPIITFEPLICPAFTVEAVEFLR